MFRKLFWLALIGVGVVAFVGKDVVKNTWQRARSAVRASLTENVPLTSQLAEARAQIDAYAEHVIRAEVASETLARAVTDAERDVRGLAARVEREQLALADVKQKLTIVPAGLMPSDGVTQEAARLVDSFRASSQALERRAADLATLRRERAATAKAVEEAHAEQVRLDREVAVLAAELQSLEARQAAARTREAVGDASLSANGYASARERLDAIRTAIAEKDKLLKYYEVRRETQFESASVIAATPSTPAEALSAIDDALASWPVEAR